MLARVRHLNVVTIHGADLIGAQAGLWRELVQGRTLEALRQGGETFPPAEVSSPAAKETPPDFDAVGRRLGANHLLLGRVIGEAGSIRKIEASLVRVVDRQTIWAGSFAPSNEDLFAARRAERARGCRQAGAPVRARAKDASD